MEFKAVAFENSSKQEFYKEYLSQSFHYGLIGSVGKRNIDGHQPIFSSWKGKDMGNWYLFTGNGYKLEFQSHGEPYKIINTNQTFTQEFTLPYPRNLQDFISDCDRLNITLYWHEQMVLENINRMQHMTIVEEFVDYMRDIDIKVTEIKNSYGDASTRSRVMY
jgi:hypothetical protein